MKPALDAASHVVLAVALLLAIGAAASPCAAHNRSLSYSSWRLDADGADVELRIKLLELTRRPPEHAWTQSLPDEVVLLAGNARCTAGVAERRARAPEGWAHFRWRVDCKEGGGRALFSRLLEDVAVAHTHFARVERSADARAAANAGEGSGFEERVLITGRDAHWALDGPERAAETAGTSIRRYLSLGLEHILEGYDHLAFVFALLLLAATLGEVVSLVTSFTVAHSITLGLAATGALRPEATAVEVLIGFSIALVAAENGWMLAGRDGRIRALFTAALVAAGGLAALGSGALHTLVWLGLALFSFCHFGLMAISERPARLRAAVAFAFGLIHGLGFAGVLLEIELPAGRVVQALLGFNVGVELGQLAVVAIVWPLLRGLARVGDGRWELLLAEAGSAAVLALGLYWAVVRNWA